MIIHLITIVIEGLTGISGSISHHQGERIVINLDFGLAHDVEQAGFDSIEMVTERRIEVPADLLERSLTAAQRAEAEQDDLHVLSVTVRAMKG